MELAIDKLRADIGKFMVQLQTKRKAYEESMNKDEVLANTKKILQEIKQLESTIIAVVEDHFKKV